MTERIAERPAVLCEIGYCEPSERENVRRLLGIDSSSEMQAAADSCLVARVGKQTVGVLLFNIQERQGDIRYVVVDPKNRKQGIGTQLLAQAEHELAEKGATSAVLRVDRNNSRIKKFFTRQGWELVRQPYKDPGEPAVMRKILPAAPKAEATETTYREYSIPVHPEKVAQYPSIKAWVGEHPRNRIVKIAVRLDLHNSLSITLGSESWEDRGSTCQFLWQLVFKNRKFESACWQMSETANSGTQEARLHNLNQLDFTSEQGLQVFRELDLLIRDASGRSLRQRFPHAVLKLSFRGIIEV